MGRGDEAVSEAEVLSSREQSQDSRDLVLGLYGGIGQTGSEAVLLRVLRTWLCDLCIPLGSVGGVLVRRSSRKKMSQMESCSPCFLFFTVLQAGCLPPDSEGAKLGRRGTGTQLLSLAECSLWSYRPGFLLEPAMRSGAKVAWREGARALPWQ